MSPSDQTPRRDAEAHDEALAALYRQAALEKPSARHDAAILAAAAADLARPAPARRAWWLRWRMGLSLAVTVILSAGIVLLVEREQTRSPPGELPPAPQSAPRRAPGAEPAPAAEVPHVPAAPPRATEEGPAANTARADGRSEEPATDASKARSGVSAESAAPATAPRQKRDAAREEDRAAIPEPPSPASRPLEPFPEDWKPSGKAESTSSPVSPYSVTAPKGSAPPSASPGAIEPLGAERQRRAMEAPPALAVPLERGEVQAPTPGKAARELAAPRPPEVWLAEIRSLHQAGRDTEARTALQAFHRAYPDHPLPPDLAPLQSSP